jgi:predicted nucleotidyltransferase
MTNQHAEIDKLLYELKERAKELNCLYEVQELISHPDLTIDEVCQCIIDAIPPGWQYPDICQAKLTCIGKSYQTGGYVETPWVQSAKIVVQDESVGSINVYYTEERPNEDEGPFLKEERRLIEAIADQVGNYILHQQLKDVFEERKKSDSERKAEWWVILDLLKRTDPKLLMRISRKMINYLFWSGITEAEQLLEQFSPTYRDGQGIIDVNYPSQIETGEESIIITDKVYELAGKYLSEQTILDRIQQWIREDQTSFLVDVLVDPSTSIAEIGVAIERFNHLGSQELKLSGARGSSVLVSLIRRLLSDQPSFISVAKKFIQIEDFDDLIQKIIYPSDSHGRLGGKGAGLFLATQILKNSSKEDESTEPLLQVKTPKTWYIASDNIFYFMRYNNLEDIIEQKYKDIHQIRQEYPYVVHVFKNASFPPEIINQLTLILDDLRDVPLIVRSSSLLEDQMGMSFAGKYKSLFIANQGTKEERLVALKDAIAEVYASMFAPDPIEYRLEHGLIDNHEEMGILIQEVVGTRIGDYYLPVFAGVAFSNNEFRWSSRIQREDGLVRVVTGLGTRAVDRLSDDYPVLAAPGKPHLRVNVTIDETIRYSPRMMDVINLKNRSFETIDIDHFLRKNNREFPHLHHLVSIISEDHIKQPKALGFDFDKHKYVVTFEGLLSQTNFLNQISAVMEVLQEHFKHPIDIEFASDGKDFYLLQCRSQSYREEAKPALIPREILQEDVVFTANRYISNGTLSNITHVVYVDPLAYAEIADYQKLLAVGRVVGRLNKILPKRQFILMGPGRWGSRGDRRLGVNVTYSDISNTIMLIEIAMKRGDYVPEPSFGTHFFQDLVEASIRYLPLYPDDSSVVFNEGFLSNSKNMLEDMLPDFSYLSDVIRVIDVPASTGGQIIQILMNADSEEAIALLTSPSRRIDLEIQEGKALVKRESSDRHWRWRISSVENIAAHLDPQRFGVEGMYVFGSTKEGTAGPRSDIDLLIHFQGSEAQKRDLMTWLEGWSLSLTHVNYQYTGYETKEILDLHFISDEDIEKRTSYAAKIGAVTDAARPLALGTALEVK